MESIDVSNIFVTDDPLTPYYNPDWNSYDQEFPLQDYDNLNMQPQLSTLEFCNTTANQILPAADELPPEIEEMLADCLENNSFNIQEWVEEACRNLSPDPANWGLEQSSSALSSSNPRIDDLSSNSSLGLLLQTYIPEQQADQPKGCQDALINFEEKLSLFNTANQVEEKISIQSEVKSIKLNIQTTLQPQNNKLEDITTPVVIKTILENEEADNQMEQIFEMKPVITSPPVLPDMTDIKTPFGRNSLTRPNTPSPSVSVSSIGTVGRRSRTGSSRNSDLRRVKNNEASKKSRLNRRTKQQTQVQLMAVLEEDNQRLTLQVEELENLKSKIMEYMTSSKAAFSSQPSE